MRAPRLVRDFFEWRWAPCVGLTAGSLAFVMLALLFIPTRIGGELGVGNTLSAFDGSRTQQAMFSSSLARSLSEPEPQPASNELRVAHSTKAMPRSGAPTPAPARGFSPIIERPES